MGYVKLDQLIVYKVSCQYANDSWIIYENLERHFKKVIGDQMIRSVDSVGANIAEGYGRYHYLDKIKFYYNARGSLLESKHWIDAMFKRKIINKDKYFRLTNYYKNIHLGLNGLINSVYKNKN